MPLRSESASERAASIQYLSSLYSRTADNVSSRKLARSIGNDKAPGLFTEGSYRYSGLSTSPDATNHHLNLLLAQWFIFYLRDRLEPLRVLAVSAFPYNLRANVASSNALFGCAICRTRYSNRLNKGGAG